MRQEQVEDQNRAWKMALWLGALMVVVAIVAWALQRPGPERVAPEPGELPAADQRPDEEAVEEVDDGPLHRPPGTAPADPRRPASAPYDRRRPSSNPGGTNGDDEDTDEQSFRLAPDPSKQEQAQQEEAQLQAARRRLEEYRHRTTGESERGQQSASQSLSDEGDHRVRRAQQASKHLADPTVEEEAGDGEEHGQWPLEIDDDQWVEGDDEFEAEPWEGEFAEAEKDIIDGQDVGRDDSSPSTIEPAGPGSASEEISSSRRGSEKVGTTSSGGMPADEHAGDEGGLQRGESGKPESDDALSASARDAVADYGEFLDDFGTPDAPSAGVYSAMAMQHLAGVLFTMSSGVLLPTDEASRQQDDLVEATQPDRDGVISESEEVDEESARDWTAWIDAADWLRFIQEEDYPWLEDLVDDVEKAAEKIDPRKSRDEQIEELTEFFRAVQAVLEAMMYDDKAS